MNNYFNYEIDLVNKFIDIKFKTSPRSITTVEVPIRWGNIDIINIKNNYIPFNNEQCKILSKTSNSRIFLKTKKNRGISKQMLLSEKGMSEKTIQNCINQLIKTKLIIKKEGLYYRNIEFTFPKVIITGYEAKLTDYNKAFYQALINKEYVDYSYMIFPMDIAYKIIDKYHDILQNNGIGLIGVSNTKQKTLLKAKRIKEIKQYVRLSNLIQTNIKASIY
ncbi:MAG: hypothetical protein IJB71_02560 [Bacilli bacterium]|nr:hypothetical protein [Bacilli bacterium]